MNKRSSREIRNESRFAILRAMFRRQPVTRQQLAASTRLSTATVATVVNELLDAGVIRVDSVGASTGRPFARLAIAAGRAALVGVDVAETHVTAHVFDLALTSLGQAEVQLDEDGSTPTAVVDAVAQAVSWAIEDAGIDPGHVGGIGVSLPGQVEPGTGVSVFAPNWSWHQVQIRDQLEQRLPYGVGVHIDNPLKAVTIAELWLGEDLDADTLAVVNLGTGVGAAFAYGGQLVRGASNNAGEWGHTMLSLDGRPCRCGRRGCVEAYVGTPGLVRTLAEVSPKHSALKLGQTDFVSVMAEGLANGDAPFVEVMSRSAHYLAAALGDLINVINPDLVVLTGWTMRALGRWWLPQVQAEMASQALPSSVAAARIVPMSLKGNPVSTGMALFALEDFLASVGLSSGVKLAGA